MDRAGEVRPPRDVMGEWSWEAAFHGSVHTATLAVATVLALFVLVLGTFGNGLVLLSALRRRKVRSNFDLLLLNLSSADLLLCVLLAPLYLYTLFTDPPAPRLFCGSLLFGGTGCGLLSLLSIVAVAIHRQARVAGRAKRSLTSRQTALVLGAVWALSGAGAAGATLHAMLDWRESYDNCQVLIYSRDPLLHRFTLFFLGPLVLVSFVVIVVSYAVIARAVRAQSRARVYQQQGGGLQALYRSAPIYRGAVTTPAPAPATAPAPAPAAGLSSKQTEPLVAPEKSATTGDGTGKRAASSPASPAPPRECHCCSCQAAAERESKAVTMCLVVILTLVLCWSPLLVSQFIELATGPSIILLQVKLCGIALVFLNSALDPYMYAQSQGAHGARGRYGRLFWDVLRCQCSGPYRGRTRFRALRTRPLGGPPPRSSLVEVDTPPSLPAPPDRGLGGKGGVERGGGGGGEGVGVKGAVPGRGDDVPGRELASSPGNERLARMAGSGQGGPSAAPGDALGGRVVTGRGWRGVFGQQTPLLCRVGNAAAATTTAATTTAAAAAATATAATNTVNTATNITTTTTSSSCRHTCRTKDVMRDVKTLVHKSCCHVHVPSDQSLVES